MTETCIDGTLTTCFLGNSNVLDN